MFCVCLFFADFFLSLVSFGLKVLYSRIAVALWRSSQGIERNIAMHSTSTCGSEHHGNNHAANHVGGLHRATVKYEKRPVGATESQVYTSIYVSFDETISFYFSAKTQMFINFANNKNETYEYKLNVQCALSLSA